MTTADETPELTPADELRNALQKGKHKRARRLARAMEPAEIVSLLATVAPRDRSRVWDLLGVETWGAVLSQLADKTLRPTRKRRLLLALHDGNNKQAKRLSATLASDQLAWVMNAVPADKRVTTWKMLEGRESDVLPLLKKKVLATLKQALGPEQLDGDDSVPTTLKQIRNALKAGNLDQLLSLLSVMHPAELADLLEALPPSERSSVWKLIAVPMRGEILVHLHAEVRQGLIRETETDNLVAAAETIPLDDLAEIIEDLPETVSSTLRLALDQRDRERLDTRLSYPDNTAGGLMDPDIVTVRADVSVGVVRRYLRQLGHMSTDITSLIVVDQDGFYVGMLPLAHLLINGPEQPLEAFVSTQVDGIPATASGEEVARIFEQQDYIVAPVVDEEGRAIGRITVDEVVDIIREQAEHDLMSMAGLDEQEDMFAPVITSARRRAVWLGVNLVTAFLAAWVIGLFEQTLEKIVALAVLMPIVASMGGIAGSQTLTLVIRGLALGQVQTSNARVLLYKELAIGVLNGIIWALVVGVLAFLWFGSVPIGAIIAAAIVINLFFAAIAGVIIPMLMDRLGVDPALAGGVVLTTVTDVVGFFAFLGLATKLLL